jgi:hypothetical protein
LGFGSDVGGWVGTSISSDFVSSVRPSDKMTIPHLIFEVFQLLFAGHCGFKIRCCDRVSSILGMDLVFGVMGCWEASSFIRKF